MSQIARLEEFWAYPGLRLLLAVALAGARLSEPFDPGQFSGSAQRIT